MFNLFNSGLFTLNYREKRHGTVFRHSPLWLKYLLILFRELISNQTCLKIGEKPIEKNSLNAVTLDKPVSGPYD